MKLLPVGLMLCGFSPAQSLDLAALIAMACKAGGLKALMFH